MHSTTLKFDLCGRYESAWLGANKSKGRTKKVVTRNTTWKKEERIRQRGALRTKFLSVLARFKYNGFTKKHVVIDSYYKLLDRRH